MQKSRLPLLPELASNCVSLSWTLCMALTTTFHGVLPHSGSRSSWEEGLAPLELRHHAKLGPSLDG